MRAGRESSESREGEPTRMGSAARAQMLMSWVNSLQLGTPKARGRELTLEDMRDGTVIAAIVRLFAPNEPLYGIQERAVSAKACAHNLNEALNVLRSKTGRYGQLYDSQGILDGRQGPTVSMLEAAVEAFVLGPELKKVVKWVRKVLTVYGRHMEPACTHVGREFGDAVSVLCLLHAFGAPNHRPEMRRVFWEPLSMAETRSNVAYALRLLDANHIPCVFTVSSWCSCEPPAPDKTCILTLLSSLHRRWGGQTISHFDRDQLLYRDVERIQQLERSAASKLAGALPL